MRDAEAAAGGDDCKELPRPHVAKEAAAGGGLGRKAGAVLLDAVRGDPKEIVHLRRAAQRHVRCQLARSRTVHRRRSRRRRRCSRRRCADPAASVAGGGVLPAAAKRRVVADADSPPIAPPAIAILRLHGRPVTWMQ